MVITKSNFIKDKDLFSHQIYCVRLNRKKMTKSIVCVFIDFL